MTSEGPPRRVIGDMSVGGIALGAMKLSGYTGDERARAFATVRAAVETGMTLLDTADAYYRGRRDMHHNERLVAEAVRALGAAAADVRVATKGGHTRPGDGWGVDGRPDYLRKACDASLQALGVECIDLYQHHRPDPRVPYVETIGALLELKLAGKIANIGISNADMRCIDIAESVLGVGGLASLQNEFSPLARTGIRELQHCASRGIAYLAYSPLGGSSGPGALDAAGSPFSLLAREKGVSAQQVTLAWELALGPHVVPIVGCSRPETVRDCARATAIALTQEELDYLNAG